LRRLLPGKHRYFNIPSYISNTNSLVFGIWIKLRDVTNIYLINEFKAPVN
jgi:hypothetical protein